MACFPYEMVQQAKGLRGDLKVSQREDIRHQVGGEGIAEEPGGHEENDACPDITRASTDE